MPDESKEDFVYETLREAILSGQLKPGDELAHTDYRASATFPAVQQSGALLPRTWSI
jgi:DNA-binding transcriptional MocR family regulator